MRIVLVIAGGLVGFLYSFACVYVWTTYWIRRSCADQGPDFIKSRLRTRLIIASVVALAIDLIMVLVDVFYWSNRGTLNHLLDRFLPNSYFEVGPAWTLWGGLFLGLVAGCITGQILAILRFPKCRRIYPVLAGIVGHNRD